MSISPPANDAADDYWYALSHVGGVFRLDSAQYVFQDWDVNALSLKLGSYVHLVRLPRGPDEYGSSCTCSHWKAVNTCLHDTILRHHVSELGALPVIAPTPLPPAVFLQTTPFRDVYIYSCVSSPGKYDSGKRVIVSYQRDGRWHCQSCRYSQSCKHIPHAMEHAALSGYVTDAEDGSVPVATESVDDTEGALLVAIGGRDEQKYGRSISYQAVPAPRWCALPHEDTCSSPPPPNTTVAFPLDALSRCSCGTTLQSLGSPLPASSVVEATLFGLTYRRAVLVEVIACPQCHHRRRSIGPDLGTTGVFNWNNTILFTHELLNAYTNMFTASETPFSAFCLTIRRQYEDHTSGMQFCSEETFVRAWFAFVQVQNLQSSMACPTCGPSPSIVIADGVSLATHASKLTSRVRPPTFTDSSSERVESISTYKARGLPAITQKDVRTLTLKCIDAIPIAFPMFPTPLPDMSKVETAYPALAGFLSLVAQTPDTRLRRVYRELARQVRSQHLISSCN
ncbi:hypothetical protein NUW54_g13262 [Trametes sanguinea]|uniref:Uncharacterized protein n=1 Tax=Trametes sanguinea TaxID=158606 RepID=A0ACC1MNN1_9APHY|nr:hypothetical protein NUW54_g13262 [Trametes sanguinea]